MAAAGRQWLLVRLQRQVKGQADFSRRFAGRVETGAPSVSDPAMSGIAIADQWRVV